MKKSLIILPFLLASSFFAEAQLLEDTDRKLRSASVERRGFLFFRSKNKVKSSDGISGKVERGASPRFSKASSPFKRTKSISPRYSKTGDKRNIGRYSTGIRYSAGNPFRGSTYKRSPRFSAGNPFRGRSYKVFPRYSPGNPFRGRRYAVSPRYSPANPFRGSRYKVSPRYSLGNPFRNARFRVTPKYSVGMPFRGRQKVAPRYSPGIPFRSSKFKVTPRYSIGIPFRGRQSISPRYSTYKNRFDFSKKRTSKYYSPGSNWSGDLKLGKKAFGEQHPSSNYRFAERFGSPGARKLLRKWNIFWTRLNGNKQNSKGVKKPVEKPKFDKKERVIWNN